ncbi:MAG: sensor histidine kinase [Culicoidibacterales bacterium]
MTIRTFLRVRIGRIVTLSSGIIGICLICFLAGLSTGWIVLFVICMMTIITINFIDEYRRVYPFYRQLLSQYEQLDQKYLLAEVIDEPDDYEGKQLYELLRKTNYYMYQEVKNAKVQSREYQEYIESWVHEIKLPIAALHLMLANNGHQQSVANITSELQRVEEYVEQVLYFARINEAKPSFVIRDCEIIPLIHTVIQGHAKTFIYQKIQLDLQLEDTSVYTDPKWLAFILQQLISNALKYTQQGGIIHVFAYEQSGTVVIEVKDTGVGIDARDVQRVFEKGYIGENGKNKVKSTGMGLYISKKLAILLEIDIQLTSEINKGTIVRLTFKQKRAHAV